MGETTDMAKKIRVPRNFDDLGRDEQFEYGGKVYTISAISQDTSERLSEIAKEMRDAINKEDYVAGNRKTFEYVVCAMQDNHDEEELKKLPKQVISAAMRLIGEEMLGVPTEGDITSSEEENVKK